MKDYFPSLTRFYDRLAALKERRIPQMCVTGLAGFSFVLGALFLWLSPRFDQAPALEFLTNAVPPLVWGTAFLAAGGFLAAVAWADFTRAVWPCFIFSAGMSIFTILSTIDLLEGPATGVVATLAACVAWFAACTGILCVAPDMAIKLHEQEDEQ